MSVSEDLLKKINEKSAVLGVIGLGYVGLPLAVEKAKAGFKTIGFDVQDHKINMVNKGENYIKDVADKDLIDVVDKGMLSATGDFSLIQKVDCIAVCVPTPLDKYHQPDISYVVESAKKIAAAIHKGMLIVLESTTYPGTTEEVIKPLLESTGLKCGKDFFLAFSPERVDPGNSQFKTKNIPKVVGGMTKSCTKVAAALYGSILEGEIHKVSHPSVAEMEKIFENTFRNINIALVNELAILCTKMGINVWEVIEAAKSKPYGFMPFYPGPGVGGHCIPIDPFYLTWKAREYGFYTRLIETAGDINEHMPDYVVERAASILNKKGKALNKAKILLLGVAYKQDIEDYRESPALTVIELLEEKGADISYNDPFIPEFKHNGKSYKSSPLTEEVLNNADLVILLTMHSCYDYKFIQKNSGIIFDTKNAMRDLKKRTNIELL